MTAARTPAGPVHEIRFHGRGGQGVVTSAELLSAAAFIEGLAAQAIPSFGSERTGAPVVAFCRVSAQPIRAHDPVVEPAVVVVADPTMLHVTGILDGLQQGGLLLVNSTRRPEELGLPEGLADSAQVVTLPATALARERLGRPLPNTALLGALAALTDLVSLDSLQRAVRERFTGANRTQNAALAADGHRLALAGLSEGAGRAQAG